MTLSPIIGTNNKPVWKGYLELMFNIKLYSHITARLLLSCGTQQFNMKSEFLTFQGH